MANEPVIFGTQAVDELRAVVRKVLGELPPGRPDRPGRPGNSDNRPTLLGKTVGSHAKGATQDVAIYSGDTLGSETDTGLTLEAYNRFADLGDDVWVHLRGVSRGWELTAGEC